MVDCVKAYARRLESDDPHWTVLEVEQDGLHPLVRAGLIRRNGFEQEWTCECKDSDQCGERSVRVKRAGGKLKYEFYCPRSCSWRPVSSEEVEWYVPDEEALLRRLCDAFGIHAGEPCHLSSGIVGLGLAAESFAHNDRHVFYVRSFERGFDDIWHGLPEGHSHLLVVGTGDIPWRPEGDSKRRRTFRIDEILLIDEDGRVRLNRKAILSRLGNARLPKKTKEAKSPNTPMKRKAKMLFDWMATRILDILDLMRREEWNQAEEVAETTSTQKKLCKQASGQFPISEAEISRMKSAVNADGTLRFFKLRRAVEIVTHYEAMRHLFDNPREKPDWLVTFKPNASSVNRALMTTSSAPSRGQPRPVRRSVVSPAKPQATSSRPQSPKSEEEMSPEERDRDDAAFIKDMFGQTADDDGSETEPDGTGEYNPDDED